ncbi:hypothetical protein FCM35_KLT09144 [Carex littledalei]|uniref:Uncharacterized protein n=1 Tax=Carex littledalei TaxID=544730 RepID=A0A833QN21_9POAL|nr:hypothetical protein FCM35_KLT09144 [Carex littledalei]
MRNGDEIGPSTEEEGGNVEEEEEEGDANDGEANHVTSIQATENCRHKRSLCHGFSRFIATKRRKMKKKSEPVSDSVPSRSQISCCLLPPCFTRPQSLNPDSPLSAPAFQSLIEKNDFYSKECNVHRNLSLFRG